MMKVTLNPTKFDRYTKFGDEYIEEACGLIPHIFLEAIIAGDPDGDNPMSLQTLANRMDEIYKFGGFGQFEFPAKIDEAGMYHPKNDEDESLAPLVKLSSDPFECFVYPYGILSIRDIHSLETKTSRFD